MYVVIDMTSIRGIGNLQPVWCGSFSKNSSSIAGLISNIIFFSNTLSSLSISSSVL